MSSKLILGTVQFGLNYGINNSAGKPSIETIEKIFTRAHASGIGQLDTAEAYGDAQKLIGEFHQKQNIRFDVNTKFKGVQPEMLGNELTKAINDLKVESINTWFYHSFADYNNYPGLGKELAEIKKQQLIKKIGVSVYSNTEFEKVVGDEGVDVIQLPFNLLDNFSYRGELLTKAKQHQKTIQVRSVFLQGLFFKDLTTLPVYLLPLKPYLVKLHRLSEEKNLPMESLCLQYANAQSHIDEIIIGVDTEEQLERNILALNSHLDQETKEVIDQIQVAETALLYPYNWK
jgi:aryl-alcohol dehydrogenase-like predicted oxidoreductase